MTSECRTPSQPESLDLDYDNWQGQFEIIGPKLIVNDQNTKLPSSSILINNNNNNNSDKNNNCNNGSDDCLDDLKFNFQDQPILLNDELFLSLNSSDFINLGEDYDELNSSKSSNSSIYGPHSTLFITDSEDYLKMKKINQFEGLNNEINTEDRLNSMSRENAILNGSKHDFCDTLTEQLELLQKQVTNLADTQNIVEDRTTRTKTEYAVLQARYHMLEEQLRESELRSDERLADEQKRHREMLARVEREAQLQNENCQIRLKTIELESHSFKDENQRLRMHCDKQAVDLHSTEEKYRIAHDNLIQLQDELLELRSNKKTWLHEKNQTEELLIELNKEIDRLRTETGPALPTTSPEALRLEELHNELEELRLKNKNLEAANEEYQAIVLTRGVEEGRNLLNGTSNSLAQELEEMNQSQDYEESAALASLSQLQIAYHEKEEENLRLKHYIDTILLNIVENYPQLLEVKSTNILNPHPS